MAGRILIVLALCGAAGLAAPAASMPDTVRIPVLKPVPGRVPAAPAIFRHSTHGMYACYGCHPGLFPRYRVGFTHRDMAAGRYCAACHDGRGAFDVADAECERCHVPS